MYEQPFFITEPVSNNAFNFDRRQKSAAKAVLYVPALVEGTVQDVKIGPNIVFEDYDDDDNRHTCLGLENFIHTNIGNVSSYIFDNHNHAFAFWCLEKAKGKLQENAFLVHIDQHKDTRIPPEYISKDDASDLNKVFQYTNKILNVGNFIPAAQHIGLVSEIAFLDSEYSLKEMEERLKTSSNWSEAQNMILDIDLDFFAPDSDYIGNDFKLEIIKQLIPKASVITFATSPYFIEQAKALMWLNRISTNI